MPTHFSAGLAAMSFAALVAVSCIRKRTPPSSRAAEEAPPPGALSFAAFSEGILAAQGSPERQQLAGALDASITPLLGTFRNHGDVALDRQQKLTKKVVRQTVDYLRASPDTACAPEHKIRLYRGIGKSTLFGAQEAGKGFDVYGGFRNRVHEAASPFLSSGELKIEPLVWKGRLENGEPVLEGDPFGNKVMSVATRLASATFPSSGFLYDMGRDRGVRIASDGPADGEMSDEKIELSFERLLRDHSANAVDSPFLSATLTSEVAQLYAPALLVLDVCPQRAILNVKTSYTFEQEYLIPFFILPEEIVEVRGHGCAFADTNPDTLPPVACKAALNDTKPVSPLTQVLRDCYTNDRMLKFDPVSAFLAKNGEILEKDLTPVELGEELLRATPSLCPATCNKGRTIQGLDAVDFFTSDLVPLANDSALEILRLDWISEIPEEADVLTRVVSGEHAGRVVNVPGPKMKWPLCP